MYYAQRMTQDEIAEILATSRSNVSRMLKLVVDEGIVEFKIRGMKHLVYTKAWEALIDSYGIKALRVAPTGNTAEETKRNIGEAAAEYFTTYIKDYMKAGISWGSTLQEFVRALGSYNPLITADVVQLAAGYGHKLGPADGLEIAKELSGVLHGECYVLRSPFYIENGVAKDLMMQEAEMKSHFALFPGLDVILTGIGLPLSQYNAMYKSGCLTAAQCEEIIRQGGVADLCGRAIKSDGSACQTEVDRRIVGVSLEDIRNCPMTIALAGGIHKKSGILAALKGGYIDVLITDEQTALSLLSN
ncbi:MAG TPA: sugar-binding domain-containing protein [Feifaniaceae bacterium]|nr:sugar-binding domain-containing protein [Feifaniaceae bacterium]